MKATLSLAALAVAANAVGCNRLERRLDRWSSKAESRIERVEGRLERFIARYTEKFNCDETNPDRVADISAEELSGAIMEAVDAAILSGDFPASDLWADRDLDTGDCDLDDAVAEFEGLRDDAQMYQECWNYLSDEDGVVQADVAAYFSCDNDVFASSEWCFVEST